MKRAIIVNKADIFQKYRRNGVYITQTLEDIPKDVGTIAIIQHNNKKALHLGDRILYRNQIEPMVNYFKENFRNLKYLDIIACSMSSPWKDTFQQLSNLLGIEVRSSSGIIGHHKYSGDWILDSHNVDLTDIYFTKEILELDVHLAPLSAMARFTLENGADVEDTENRDIIIPGKVEISRGRSGPLYNFPQWRPRRRSRRRHTLEICGNWWIRTVAGRF